MVIRENSNSKIASKSICLERMSEPQSLESMAGIYLGTSKVFRIPVMLDLTELINKNIAILGMSGSGKSYFLKSFIVKSILQRGSSVLIIDWNNEYKDTVSFLGGTTLTFGTNIRINIFDLYDLKNVRNIRAISDLIGYALNLNNDENYLVYNRILSISSKNNFSINLDILIGQFRKEKVAICNRIATKLLQLRHNPMFADSTDFSINGLLEGVISIDFSMLKDDTQRTEISKTIFKIIIELMHKLEILKLQNDSEKIIVLDEGWRLIKNSEDVNVLFREGRKYGFCVAIATQLVNDIDSEIISNAGSFFLFRLQNDSDFKSLVDSGIISEAHKREIMSLPIGGCMISMTLKDHRRISKFFIERIDGIETNFYVLKRDNMQTIISNRVFQTATRELDVAADVKDRILSFISENNNEIDDTRLIDFMTSLAINRSKIVCYLRTLGLDDKSIVKAYNVVLLQK